MSIFKRKMSESEAALSELQTSFASLQVELAEAREELKSAQELSATLLAEFTRCDAENKEKDTRIASLEVELAEASRDAAEFDEKVAKVAASEIATMGHAPLEIVEDEDAPVDVVKTFKGLKGKELVEFYNSHKQEISRALKTGR
jgi:chromosome segregation ATPase